MLEARKKTEKPNPMRDDIQKLIRQINRKNWWHVRPADPRAYEKRGKFLASCFAVAMLFSTA